MVPGLKFPSSDIYQLMYPTPNLKKLNLVSTRQKRGVNVHDRLDARDIATLDWICTSLEIFRCKSEYTLRPDIICTKSTITEQPASKFIKPGRHQKSLDLQ
ncbi:hypothetical protein BGZ47_006542 [Haplosporangium gracile]|nr:hypothetical protein BGZ47_006542 [Haplosporangium gracile]